MRTICLPYSDLYTVHLTLKMLSHNMLSLKQQCYIFANSYNKGLKSKLH